MTDKHAKVKQEYVRNNPAIRRLTNKLTWLKINYGEEARQHFIENHVCARCGEDRLACLSVHHSEGKTTKKFVTLCMNCHAIEHSSEDTFEDGMTGRTKGKLYEDSLLKQLGLLEGGEK